MEDINGYFRSFSGRYYAMEFHTNFSPKQLTRQMAIPSSFFIAD
jgi:hypothetical protein